MTFNLAFGLLFATTFIVRGIEIFGVPMPSDWWLLDPIRRWALGSGHEADCSLHNGPAYRPWPCNCKRRQGWPKDRIALTLQQRAFDEGRC